MTLDGFAWQFSITFSIGSNCHFSIFFPSPPVRICFYWKIMVNQLDKLVTFLKTNMHHCQFKLSRTNKCVGDRIDGTKNGTSVKWNGVSVCRQCQACMYFVFGIVINFYWPYIHLKFTHKSMKHHLFLHAMKTTTTTTNVHKVWITPKTICVYISPIFLNDFVVFIKLMHLNFKTKRLFIHNHLKAYGTIWLYFPLCRFLSKIMAIIKKK